MNVLSVDCSKDNSQGGSESSLDDLRHCSYNKKNGCKKRSGLSSLVSSVNEQKPLFTEIGGYSSVFTKPSTPQFEEAVCPEKLTINKRSVSYRGKTDLHISILLHDLGPIHTVRVSVLRNAAITQVQ